MQQLRGFDAKCSCENCDGLNGRASFGALDAADVVAVDPGGQAQRFLGESAFISQLADRLAEADE